jgi:signal peptidase I
MSQSTSTPRAAKPRSRVLVEWVAVVVVAVLIAVLVRTFVLETYFVPSGSMVPTLQIGDRIIVDKLSVDFGTIHTGDIVVFKAPKDVVKDCGDKVTDLVKRVIGVPGDHLTSNGNTIFIDGRPLKEKWPHTEPLGSPIRPITLRAGQYYMIGDNHFPSCDSRVWGTVPRSSIIGKVFLRIWPLSRIGWI